MSAIDLTLENVRTELQEIKLRISALRKKGYDTAIVDLKMMNIPSKMKWVEATQSFKDATAVLALVGVVKKELAELEKQEPPSDERL